MGNRPLIPDTRLSWIRDTTGEDTPDPKETPEPPPKPTGSKGTKEHSARPVTETPKQQAPRHTPAPAARPETIQAPRYEEEVAPPPKASPPPPPPPRHEVRETARYASQSAHRDEIRETARQAAHQAAAPAMPIKKPSKYHYWIAVIALICVAVSVPERYSVLIFLGFIFVVLLEISYRLGQQHLLNRAAQENLNRILRALSQEDRGGR